MGRAGGAPIFAEITGFATSSDTTNIADPNSESIEGCIRLALEDAGMKADEIDYVNAHATGTVQGDIAESTAIGRVFGNDVPVSSLKGHLGHTMAACGALETIASIAMIDKGSLVRPLTWRTSILYVETSDTSGRLKKPILKLF